MRKARRPRQAGVVDPFPEDQYNNDEFETEEKKDLGNIFSSLGFGFAATSTPIQAPVGTYEEDEEIEYNYSDYSNSSEVEIPDDHDVQSGVTSDSEVNGQRVSISGGITMTYRTATARKQQSNLTDDLGLGCEKPAGHDEEKETESEMEVEAGVEVEGEVEEEEATEERAETGERYTRSEEDDEDYVEAGANLRVDAENKGDINGTSRNGEEGGEKTGKEEFQDETGKTGLEKKAGTVKEEGKLHHHQQQQEQQQEQQQQQQQQQQEQQQQQREEDPVRHLESSSRAIHRSLGPGRGTLKRAALSTSTETGKVGTDGSVRGLLASGSRPESCLASHQNSTSTSNESCDQKHALRQSASAAACGIGTMRVCSGSGASLRAKSRASRDQRLAFITSHPLPRFMQHRSKSSLLSPLASSSSSSSSSASASSSVASPLHYRGRKTAAHSPSPMKERRRKNGTRDTNTHGCNINTSSGAIDTRVVSSDSASTKGCTKRGRKKEESNVGTECEGGGRDIKDRPGESCSSASDTVKDGSTNTHDSNQNNNNNNNNNEENVSGDRRGGRYIMGDGGQQLTSGDDGTAAAGGENKNANASMNLSAHAHTDKYTSSAWSNGYIDGNSYIYSNRAGGGSVSGNGGSKHVHESLKRSPYRNRIHSPLSWKGRRKHRSQRRISYGTNNISNESSDCRDAGGSGGWERSRGKSTTNEVFSSHNSLRATVDRFPNTASMEGIDQAPNKHRAHSRMGGGGNGRNSYDDRESAYQAHVGNYTEQQHTNSSLPSFSRSNTHGRSRGHSQGHSGEGIDSGKVSDPGTYSVSKGKSVHKRMHTHTYALSPQRHASVPFRSHGSSDLPRQRPHTGGSYEAYTSTLNEMYRGSGGGGRQHYRDSNRMRSDKHNLHNAYNTHSNGYRHYGGYEDINGNEDYGESGTDYRYGRHHGNNTSHHNTDTINSIGDNYYHDMYNDDVYDSSDGYQQERETGGRPAWNSRIIKTEGIPSLSAFDDKHLKSKRNKDRKWAAKLSRKKNDQRLRMWRLECQRQSVERLHSQSKYLHSESPLAATAFAGAAPFSRVSTSPALSSSASMAALSTTLSSRHDGNGSGRGDSSFAARTHVRAHAQEQVSRLSLQMNHSRSLPTLISIDDLLPEKYSQQAHNPSSYHARHHQHNQHNQHHNNQKNQHYFTPNHGQPFYGK